MRTRHDVNTERKEREDKTLVEELADQFCRILCEWLTPEQLIEAAHLNGIEDNPGVCHSHDHCDANQAMLDAWEWLFGKDEVPAIIRAPEENAEGEEDRDVKLWNAAWALAKSKGFKCAS